jgi:hypothetical protein
MTKQIFVSENDWRFAGFRWEHHCKPGSQSAGWAVELDWPPCYLTASGIWTCTRCGARMTEANEAQDQDNKGEIKK